jgi:Rod binding domain-containing protein
MLPVAAVQQTNAHAEPSPKLVRAAHEFEAQMMKELLKPMTGTAQIGGDDDDAGSAGALGEYATESLGKALSAQGGFGLANQIIHELSHSSNSSAAGKVTRDLHGNTVIGAMK